jgi:queuine tRNA-ribosyltransferase
LALALPRAIARALNEYNACMAFRFEVLCTDGSARQGRLHTAHGSVQTPVFMAVGTQASVKGLTPAQLDDAGVQVVLGNTYHLALRPGDELIAEQGGLHRFMGWRRPILTDSGGYQVYSLAANLKIDDHAAVFRSHLDGTLLELTPEKAVRIQENLGSDIAMCLDECPPADADAAHRESAVARTLHWAERCRAAHRRGDQALFAIVQGGTDIALRVRCAEELTRLDFPGYALGGFSVGESMQQMLIALEPAANALPADKPRYLMGVGRPIDLVLAVKSGIDMFDCVLPTRNGRMGHAYTSRGEIAIKHERFKEDLQPLDASCACPVCGRHNRAYLRNLFVLKDFSAPMLLSIHNVFFYLAWMRAIREAIAAGRLATLAAAPEEKIPEGA